jgi:hypothetical protein
LDERVPRPAIAAAGPRHYHAPIVLFPSPQGDSRMIRNRLCLLLVAAGLLWPFTSGQAQVPKPVRLEFTVKDVDSALETRWFGVYEVKGDKKKIGYMSAGRVKVTEGGKTVYREEGIISLKLVSGENKAELLIEEKIDFDSAPPFRMVRAELRKVGPGVTENILLTPKGKGYAAVITIGKNTVKKDINDIDYTLADTISSEMWIKRKPKNGDTLTSRSLELEELEVHHQTMTLVDSKETLINGVKLTVYDVKSLTHETKTASEGKYDDQGRLLSAKFEGFMEMRLESEADAKNTEFGSDIFEAATAKIDRKIGSTDGVTGLILEIDKEGEHLPNGPRQSVEPKGKDAYLVKLGAKYGKKVKATDKEIKDSLKETIAYPITDTAIKELATKAVGEAKTDQDKVKRICQFVYDYIKPKVMASIPRIHDLIERKCGDCKSYALMFTCLARAAGLPSREVSGFVYMGDKEKAFGGHAWCEVLLDGYWQPVDASMNQTDADATHILLGTDKDASGLLKTFGKLNFKLIEVERAK